MSRARTVERRKEREQERKRQRQTLVLGGIVAAVVILAVLIVLINQPAEAPIPPETATRYEGLVQGKTDEGFPTLGSNDAPVKVVEYSSFDCTHCKDFHENVTSDIVDRVRNGEVQFTYVPIYGTGSLQNGLGAAKAAICAGEQGLFWQTHDALFNWQGLYANTAFSQNRLNTGMTNLGVDKTQWDACMAGDQAVSVADAAVKAGQAQNIPGTPSVFVNGSIVQTPDLASVNAAIDAALAAAGLQPVTPAEATPEATAAPAAEATTEATAAVVEATVEVTTEAAAPAAEATVEATPEATPAS